jgi:hypothetical protein
MLLPPPPPEPKFTEYYRTETASHSLFLHKKFQAIPPEIHEQTKYGGFMNRVKTLLVAGIALVLAFTLSCSSDNKDSGWLTCSELNELGKRCDDKLLQEYEICDENRDKEDKDICDERAEAKDKKCFMDGACNGSNWEKCREHYKECGYDDEDDE